jgi:adenylate cyclase
MFTDMVGYTALMQEDEHRATQNRDLHRSILRAAIEGQGGEIVQLYGDGTLSVFPSAVNSVATAVEIQKLLRMPPEIPVRIGLHVGDIVHDEDGIHGDGVNVAARVQGLATPGSVLLSRRVSELAASTERPKKSIAVLPFVSMSSDRDDEYFVDGITEEILNALVKFEGLGASEPGRLRPSRRTNRPLSRDDSRWSRWIRPHRGDLR